MPLFSDTKTLTERLGHTKLRSFTDEHDHFWLEQNPAKNSQQFLGASHGTAE